MFFVGVNFFVKRHNFFIAKRLVSIDESNESGKNWRQTDVIDMRGVDKDGQREGEEWD